MGRRLLTLAVLAIGFVLQAALAAPPPTVLHVPGDYSTIQAAINAAAAGNHVVIAAGTYHECLNFNGKAITVRGTAPLDPAVVAATVINGDAAGAVVTFNHGELGTSQLRGVTITNGSGDDNGAGFRYGGGIYCSGSAPLIERCRITGNTVNHCAGGIAVFWGSPTIRYNTISDNHAETAGGGLGLYDSRALVSFNMISDNTTEGHGGGVALNEDSPTFEDNTFSGNSADHGGAIHTDTAAPPVRRCTFDSNTADTGAGIYVAGGSVTVTASAFGGNTGALGAAVYCLGDLSVTGTLFAGNTATNTGCVYCAGGAVSLTGDTFHGNAGGVYLSNAPATLRNCLIAAGVSGPGVQVGSGAAPQVVYCDVYGNAGGNYLGLTDPTGTEGNLSADPLLADPAAGNFRLRSAGGRWNGTGWVRDHTQTSPCIDAGDPASPYDLEPQDNGGRVNIGYDGNTAYASKQGAPEVLTWSPRGTSAAAAAPVCMTFNVAMHKPSVESNFVLTPDTDGSFTWSGRKLTFTPASNWPAGRRTRVTINAAARSAAGLRLGTAFTWSFQPAAAPAAVRLACAPTGPGAQLSVTLSAEAGVAVTFRNLAGRAVGLLQPGRLPAGQHTLLWSGVSLAGGRCPPGTYLVEVTARLQDGRSATALGRLNL